MLSTDASVPWAKQALTPHISISRVQTSVPGLAPAGLCAALIRPGLPDMGLREQGPTTVPICNPAWSPWDGVGHRKHRTLATGWRENFFHQGCWLGQALGAGRCAESLLVCSLPSLTKGPFPVDLVLLITPVSSQTLGCHPLQTPKCPQARV